MEKKLWAAVLLTAFRDLKTKRAGSASWWFLKSSEDGPGSCLWICQALGIDVEHVRARAVEIERKYRLRAAA